MSTTEGNIPMFAQAATYPIELFFDADWYIGSGLTTSGKALQLQVRQGKFFTAEMSPEEVRTLGIVPNSVRKSADSRLRMRYRPLMKIESAELTLTPECPI